jgi:hypothetical protein
MHFIFLDFDFGRIILGCPKLQHLDTVTQKNTGIEFGIIIDRPPPPPPQSDLKTYVL